MQEAFGIIPYPTLVEKAAALLEGVARAHGFRDANKRTAWTWCTTFLGLHGVLLVHVPDEEVADFVVDVVEGKYTLAQFAEWLLERQA
jgi:death-on-curing protein